MIIDSGCSLTVVGKSVFEEYIHALESFGLDASYTKSVSHSSFRFANGSIVSALHSVVFPVYLNGNRFQFRAHVLPTRTPFLLGCNSMSRARFVLNFENRTVSSTKLGLDNYPLLKSGASQYCIPLFSDTCIVSASKVDCINESVSGMNVVHQLVESSLSTAELEKLKRPGEIERIHKSLNHISTNKLWLMLKNAGADSEIRKLVDNMTCDVCWKFKRPYLKPISGGFLATTFNELVVMDLSEFKWNSNKVILCNMVDVYSRWCFARIVPDKSALSIYRVLAEYANAAGSYPKYFFGDCGTEFSNKLVCDWLSKHDVRFMSTSGYTPWSNGICEKRNDTLKSYMIRACEECQHLFDVGKNLDIILSDSVRCVNSTPRKCGLTPFSIAFSIMSVPFNILPDEKEVSELRPAESFVDHLRNRLVLQSKIQSIVLSSVCTDKVRVALKSRLRNNEAPFYDQEWVYVHEKPQEYSKGFYHGPWRVVGHTGKTYLLKQGARKRDVPEHLISRGFKNPEPKIVDNSALGFSENGAATSDVVAGDSRRILSDKFVSSHSLQRSQGSVQPIVGKNLAADSLRGSQSMIPKAQSTGSRSARIIVVPDDSIVKQESVSNDHMSDVGASSPMNPSLLSPIVKMESFDVASPGMDLSPDASTSTKRVSDRVRVRVRPNTGATSSTVPVQVPLPVGPIPADITTKLQRSDSDSDISQLDLNSHLRVDCDKCGASMDYSCVDDHRNLFCHANLKRARIDFVNAVLDQPKSHRVVTKQELQEYQHLFDAAKLKEFNSWKSNNVMTEVPAPDLSLFENKNVISVRWVITWKKSDTGSSIPKCRLVAKGFEDQQASDVKTDSPTISKQSLMLALQFLVENQWEPMVIDLSTAFLQSDPYAEDSNREIYLVPPDDAYRLLGYSDTTCMLWRLNKTTYGLKDAPLVWYTSFYNFLISEGLKRCSVDDALFYHQKNGLLAMHVDDFLCGGNESFQSIVNKIRTVYKVGKEQLNAFTFCGVQITVSYENSEFSISLDQSTYILSLVEMDIPSRSDLSSLVGGEFSMYRSLLGRVSWISLQTRCDVAFEVNQLSLSMTNPTVAHARRLNKVVRILKNFAYIPLRFVKTKIPRICVVSDASYNLESISGYFVLFACTESNCINFIKWSSTKIKRVTTSSMASEAFALKDALDKAILARLVYSELSGKRLDIHAFTDSRTLQRSCYSHKSSNLETNVLIVVRYIRELLDLHEISCVKYINTKQNIADFLTKSIANKEFLRTVLLTNEYTLPE